MLRLATATLCALTAAGVVSAAQAGPVVESTLYSPTTFRVVISGRGFGPSPVVNFDGFPLVLSAASDVFISIDFGAPVARRPWTIRWRKSLETWIRAATIGRPRG